jgi:hypothetical protein
MNVSLCLFYGYYFLFFVCTFLENITLLSVFLWDSHNDLGPRIFLCFPLRGPLKWRAIGHGGQEGSWGRPQVCCFSILLSPCFSLLRLWSHSYRLISAKEDICIHYLMCYIIVIHKIGLPSCCNVRSDLGCSLHYSMYPCIFKVYQT